jgi:hypothetical protein
MGFATISKIATVIDCVEGLSKSVLHTFFLAVCKPNFLVFLIILSYFAVWLCREGLFSASRFVRPTIGSDIDIATRCQLGVSL